MTKAARHAAILEAVRRRTLRTQEELASVLERQGIRATQVTLSRDLRELGVMKATEGYVSPDAVSSAPAGLSLERVFREFLLDAIPAGNLVVLKTRPGGAGPVALALDRADWPEVVGTIAGDDTVFAATASAAVAESISARLRPE